MKDINSLLQELDNAVLAGDVELINRINNEIVKGLGGVVTESSLDYELIKDIEGKSVYNNLIKALRNKETSNGFLIKLLSSLITHIAIECDTTGKNLKDYPVKTFLNAIDNLVYNPDYDRGEIVEFLRNRYARFTQK